MQSKDPTKPLRRALRACAFFALGFLATSVYREATTVYIEAEPLNRQRIEWGAWRSVASGMLGEQEARILASDSVTPAGAICYRLDIRQPSGQKAPAFNPWTQVVFTDKELAERAWLDPSCREYASASGWSP